VISYLHGTLKQKHLDRVVVDVGGVGYDVFLPQFVMRTVGDRSEGEPVEFEIYYHVTERQIRPTLIGFNSGHEKRFFEKFISVEDIGPQKAVRALCMSVSTIAQAIENEDFNLLRQLPGIGERTARKMVATLRGKVTEEAMLRDQGYTMDQPSTDMYQKNDVREDSIDILESLGHRRMEAVSKVDSALARNPALASPEELIRDVYRSERGALMVAGSDGNPDE
jgi:holliday junction DNA helicase RuvA